MRLTKLGLLLLEVIVGTADDRVCVLEFAVEVFSVLPVSDLDMHEQPLGHPVKLMANSFDEHAVMADPLIDVLEPVINALVPVVYLLESEINLPEPAIIRLLKPPMDDIGAPAASSCSTNPLK